MKIGITERGDAALDLSWTTKMNQIDGAVLITKNCASPAFIEAVKQFKNKVIVHATITGNGDSFIEPNVPHPHTTLAGLYELVRVLDPSRLVLRIDPIIPNDVGIAWIPYLINNLPQGISRIRFSIIDNYNHIKDRGLHLPWNGLHAPESMVTDVVNTFLPYTKNFSIESCGEEYPVIPENWKSGCISYKDLKILGLIYNPISNSTSYQRRACRCLSIKTELLNRREKCAHGCLYCYWKG